MQTHNYPPHIHCTGHWMVYLKAFKSFLDHSLHCLQYMAFLHSGCVQTTVRDVTWMSDHSVHLAKWMPALEQVTSVGDHLAIKIIKVYQICIFF